MRDYKKNNPQKVKNYYVENQEKYKQYRDSKKDLNKDYMKSYYLDNLENRKQYLEETKEDRKIKRKEYNKKNSNILKEKRKKYYTINKEKISEYNKNYRKNNIEKEVERWKNYYENNKKELIIKSVDISLEKRKKYPIERLKHNVRNRTREIFKHFYTEKKHKTFDIVGCTPQELKIHLEEKFIKGMSWDNQGEWHIDHKIPLSSAKTEEELHKLCHFTNLQPMWVIDNIKKGSKIL